MPLFNRSIILSAMCLSLSVAAWQADASSSRGAEPAKGATGPLIAPTTSESEREAVKIPLALYLQGQSTDQGDYFRKAFSADARIIGYSASSRKFVNLSVEQFAGNFVGKNPEDPQTHHRSFEILEITGTVAVARVSSDLPESRYTDYMSLQKIDGEWKIVNKSFYQRLK